MNQEQALFAAFVIPGKRERYVELLGTKRGRERVRGALDHFKDLNPHFCRKVAGQDSKPAAVLDALRKLGAPTECHVISVDGEWTGAICHCPMRFRLRLVEGRVRLFPA